MQHPAPDAPGEPQPILVGRSEPRCAYVPLKVLLGHISFTHRAELIVGAGLHVLLHDKDHRVTLRRLHQQLLDDERIEDQETHLFEARRIRRKVGVAEPDHLELLLDPGFGNRGGAHDGDYTIDELERFLLGLQGV